MVTSYTGEFLLLLESFITPLQANLRSPHPCREPHQKSMIAFP